VTRQAETEDEMCWSRWSNWQAGDPRGRVRVIDTSAQPVEQVASELVEWIDGERALVRVGAYLLTGSSLACDP
jgi:hypothetical protein